MPKPRKRKISSPSALRRRAAKHQKVVNELTQQRQMLVSLLKGRTEHQRKKIRHMAREVATSAPSAVGSLALLAQTAVEDRYVPPIIEERSRSYMNILLQAAGFTEITTSQVCREHYYRLLEIQDRPEGLMFRFRCDNCAEYHYEYDLSNITVRRTS